MPSSHITFVENKLADASHFLQEVMHWQKRSNRSITVEVIGLFDPGEYDSEMISALRERFSFARFIVKLVNDAVPAENAQALAEELATRVARGDLVFLDHRLSRPGKRPAGWVTTGADLARQIAELRRKEKSGNDPLAGVVILSRFLSMDGAVLKTVKDAGAHLVLKWNWEELFHVFEQWAPGGRITIANEIFEDAETANGVVPATGSLNKVKLWLGKTGLEAQGTETVIVISLIAFIICALIWVVTGGTAIADMGALPEKLK